VDAINDPEFSNGQLRVDGSNADVQDALRNSGYAECAGLNRHVVGVQVPAGKEVANPS
jgi:hypothetical protein